MNTSDCPTNDNRLGKDHMDQPIDQPTKMSGHLNIESR